MKRLYIFDFDGTLVNTFYDSVIAYNNALRIHNMEEYHYNSLDEVDFTDFVNSMTHDEDVLNTYWEEYKKSQKEHTLVYPKVTEVLYELMNDNNTLAICSNRTQDHLDELTNKLFPEIDFKYVIGYVQGEDFKPNPGMINKIIENEEYKKDEIVYIGDKVVDIETAKNVDIDVVIVKWGQGTVEAYTDEYPLKVISDADELLRI